MSSLKEVRNSIKSVSSTQQITKAMKMVAAAKLRKSQDAITQLRPYSLKLDAILSNLSDSSSNESVFSVVRPVNNVLIIVITSDRGLCGPFNSNILKATLQLIEEKYKSLLDQNKVTLLCIGKKGFEYFNKRGYKVIGDYVTLFQSLNFNTSRPASEKIMLDFQNEVYDVVDIVYNEFKNVATQVIHTDQFLPIIGNIDSSLTLKANNDYIFEPNQEYILSDLIPRSLKISFLKSLLDSNASENGARMTAMDKATENAGEMLKALKLSYNRTRQAAITKEILEIVGGAEALKNT